MLEGWDEWLKAGLSRGEKSMALAFNPRELVTYIMARVPLSAIGSTQATKSTMIVGEHRSVGL